MLSACIPLSSARTGPSACNGIRIKSGVSFTLSTDPVRRRVEGRKHLHPWASFSATTQLETLPTRYRRTFELCQGSQRASPPSNASTTLYPYIYVGGQRLTSYFARDSICSLAHVEDSRGIRSSTTHSL
jgi:hypothetical protein